MILDLKEPYISMINWQKKLKIETNLQFAISQKYFLYLLFNRLNYIPLTAMIHGKCCIVKKYLKHQMDQQKSGTDFSSSISLFVTV